MHTASEVEWTLWVFAGPGAFGGETPGQVLPLADAVGELPVGVALLAETVGEPTLLQQLTGQWPCERLVRGLDVQAVPRAERNLGSFLAWAQALTPNGSKRALIVLGDVLHAIGEVPASLGWGVYRPPYPTQLTIKKGSTTTTYSRDSRDPMQYNIPGQNATLLELVSDLKLDEEVTFGSDGPYVVSQTGLSRRYTKGGTTYTITISTSNPTGPNAIVFTPSQT
ncbi:hypothetical protein [Paraliomyxa miuraensis]|uniref:hypothetical protein n=1 Tax=Paraliomyxa miuraensis TaxID=376150 RepID=UPI00224D01AA|nr:hypothetical protein [Paraliomyxa miuraensis]MCX4242703.1 hypothetical protein [Paraliomyxa miuraensis]